MQDFYYTLYWFPDEYFTLSLKLHNDVVIQINFKILLYINFSLKI